MKKLPLITAILFISLSAFSQKKKNNSQAAPDPIQAFAEGKELKSGFMDFYYDESAGKVFLKVEALEKELLYVNSLAAGVGSNDIGLDRGQLGGRRVVKFERYGPKLLLVQPNQGYRAVSENADEVQSVQEAFASSVLGGFNIVAESGNTIIVDITKFLLRDAHGIKQRLKRTKQGSYSIDNNRSAIYPKGCFNFPKNTELEAILTFKGDTPGNWVRSVTPSPNAITVRTHHSFIELPDDDYEPRAFDPRSGYIHISYQDYATPIEEPLVKRFIARHRLKKKNPGAATSEAVEPIIYYLDRGAPEPIKSALMEGAAWWNQAFEAAGYENAFQIKVLPEDAHPLDVRYNVIQWVHRSTRGWSYGASVVDPRTGEIIKGHVSLGSLRVRQDFLIAEGLLQPYDGSEEVPTEMTEMALARLRQLSAHEVGHTIGLVHNFASSYNDRASVMDYPHPYVKMDDSGKIDLSEAYDVGIGEWDKIAITFGYGEFDSQKDALAVLEKATNDGYLHISDRDARPVDGVHPRGHLWDNGKSASEELNRMMSIRRNLLDRFSENSLQSGKPMSSIEEVLVPIYLFHRYQVDATSKTVGGINYSYAMKGDGQVVTEMIDPEEQKAAVDALLNTLDPAALELSPELLAKIPPKAHGFGRSRETFVSNTGPAFDYFAAAKTAASVPLFYLLNTARANRLLMYKSIEASQPGLDWVLNRLVEKCWGTAASDAGKRELQKIVQMRVLEELQRLSADPKAYPGTQALALKAINDIRSKNASSRNEYSQLVVSRIDDFLDNPKEFKAENLIKAPDGSPIGSWQHIGCSGHLD